MKVNVTFVCELKNVEVDDKFRKLCRVHLSKEEKDADEPLFCELRDAADEALQKLGYSAEFIDVIESDDGWLLYED